MLRFIVVIIIIVVILFILRSRSKGNIKINQNKSYCIVSAFADDIVDFTESVQALISDGWSTIGGISAANSMLYQALSKK